MQPKVSVVIPVALLLIILWIMMHMLAQILVLSIHLMISSIILKKKIHWLLIAQPNRLLTIRS